MNKRLYRNVGIGVAILATFSLLVFPAEPDATTPPEIAFSDFLTRIEDQQVDEVTIEEGQIHGRLRDGGEFTTYAPVIADALIADLYDRGIAIRAQPKTEPGAWAEILLAWLPILLIVGFFVFFVRQMQAGGGLATRFGKSGARRLDERGPRATFEDVAGIEEAKAELEEIIAFLREPKKFTRTNSSYKS